jgi:hypothetical protein
MWKEVDVLIAEFLQDLRPYHVQPFPKCFQLRSWRVFGNDIIGRFRKRHTLSRFQLLPALYQWRKFNSVHLVDQMRRKTMVNDVWKRIGIILSALWLLVAGFFEGIAICFSGWMSGSECLWTQSLYVLAYIVFGLGPVLAFILLIKKRYEPIGYRALTVLALFAASPIFLVLLCLLQWGCIFCKWF